MIQNLTPPMKQAAVIALVCLIAIVIVFSVYWQRHNQLVEVVESVITFKADNQNVKATLLRPAGEPRPVVLLLHGFTGSRNELATKHVKKGIYAHTAFTLAQAGYASLRIDFRGSGESLDDLNFSQTTFEAQVSDGLAAIDYLRSLDSVDVSRLHVIGTSQGGLVATAVAGRANLTGAIALWNPVVDPQSTYGRLLGEQALKAGFAAAADEPIVTTTSFGKKIILNGAFYHGVRSFSPPQEIASFSGPLLVVQGEDDKVVNPDKAPELIAAHNGESRLLMLEMDHVFNVFSTKKTLNKIISKTIAYFNAT